jgi:hypothetical protein
MIDPSHLDELCPELRALLNAELVAGNQVVETSKGWPEPGSIFVLLGFPFRSTPDELPSGVSLVEVNDPHWWKAEYHHLPTHHVLGCRF